MPYAHRERRTLPPGRDEESLKTLLILLETAERVPLIMNDDAGFHVFHAACAAALAIAIQVDLCTFFNPPAPYHQFFVLTTGEAEHNDGQGGSCAINGS